jgi:hypothetical protein
VTPLPGKARRMPLGPALLLLVSLVVTGVVAWVAYDQGQRAAGHDAAAIRETERAQQEQVDRLQAENRKLHARVAELEMSRQLDRDAYGQVERTLGNLQSQLARQGDDLAFYRSIVAPEDGIQGLRIQRFDALPGSGPREVLLKLTLVQAMRHESLVAGLAQVTLAGMQGGRAVSLSVGELLGRPRAQLPFSFRYFQTIEQTVTLPEGFEVFEARVQVRSSKLRAPIQQSFPWKVGQTAAL